MMHPDLSGDSKQLETFVGRFSKIDRLVSRCESRPTGWTQRNPNLSGLRSNLPAIKCQNALEISMKKYPSGDRILKDLLLPIVMRRTPTHNTKNPVAFRSLDIICSSHLKTGCKLKARRFILYIVLADNSR